MLTKSDVQKIKKVVEEVAVTKSDAKNFATKDDLIGLARSSELDSLKETFITNLEKWKNELFNKIDGVLGQLKSAEQEKAILEARQDEPQKLEKRVEKLEKIHPNNRHSFP